jgi:hypothetical protein
MARGDSSGAQGSRDMKSKARFVSWEIVEPHGDNPHILTEISHTALKFTVEVNDKVSKGHHGIVLYDRDRNIVWGWATNDVELLPGEHEFRYAFPMLPLRPGPYAWLVSLWEEGRQLDAWECLPEMIVATEGHQHPRDEFSGVLNIPSAFEIQERVVTAVPKGPV